MSVAIRPYEPSDFDDVAGLFPRLAIGVAPWRDPRAVRRAVLDWLEHSTSRDFDGAALVATDATRVVGFVSVATARHFSGEVDAYVGELVVSEAAEGRGVGGRLLEAAEAWARLEGLRCLTLTTGAANSHALAFYERRGFVGEDVKLTKELG